jgi:NAD(P)-dependent dehydrogenase (short-subunit alcohol dehydrogenase family)
METVFVSNARDYTGPGVVDVLSRAGYRVVCHDRTFIDESARAHFTASDAVVALRAQAPEDLVDEINSYGPITRFVFNDAHANAPKPFEDIDLQELRAAHAALVEFPFRLCQLVLPSLKQSGTGAIVFVTSARQLQPEPGFTVATSVRAGATALALSVAREAAPHGVQVNALQPNYLYSEMYYPRAQFVDDPAGRAAIAATVPAGRLGQPAEFGQLVEFFISGRSPFTTGQAINFTGGWP